MGAANVLAEAAASAGMAGGGGTIVQASPTTGTTSTVDSSSFADQLSASAPGAITFVTTSTPNGVVVSSSGAVSATGPLAVGSYPVSGTDFYAIGDLVLGSGTWSYTLTVTSATIIQQAPLSNTTGAVDSSSFADQLSASAPGAVTFVTTSTPNGVVVSSSGAVSVSGPEGAGAYTVSGTDTDAVGDSGTWSYTLTVSLVSQRISFISTPPSPALDGGTYTVSATGGGSGNPVDFESATTSVCTVSGSTVRFVGLGTCTIDATEAGSPSYAAAPAATESFAVVQADPPGDVSVPGATNVHAGEPWAGSRPWEALVGASGLALVACGELRRRRTANAEHRPAGR